MDGLVEELCELVREADERRKYPDNLHYAAIPLGYWVQIKHKLSISLLDEDLGREPLVGIHKNPPQT